MLSYLFKLNLNLLNLLSNSLVYISQNQFYRFFRSFAHITKKKNKFEVLSAQLHKLNKYFKHFDLHLKKKESRIFMKNWFFNNKIQLKKQRQIWEFCSWNSYRTLQVLVYLLHSESYAVFSQCSTHQYCHILRAWYGRLQSANVSTNIISMRTTPLRARSTLLDECDICAVETPTPPPPPLPCRWLCVWEWW